MSRFCFKTLKRLVPIEMVLEAYGLKKRLKRRRYQLYGPCPLHLGDNPTAFRVDLQRNIWHCFTACGGGDTVDLVRRARQCSYAQAARQLQLIADGCTSSVPASNTKHIQQGRHTVFRAFTMKIPLQPDVPFLVETKGILPETALYFNAGCTKRSSFLKNTVAVRLHDMTGGPLGYCGRHLEPGAWGKWRFARGFAKATTLFNAHRARAHIKKGMVIVECPWAVMRLTQAGVPNAVALLGTGISSHQLRWLAAAPKVLLMLDGDKPGRRATAVIARSLCHYTNVAIHELADELEPEDLTDDELLKIAIRHFSFF